MNILLYNGCWPQNIGNAFFDFGLEAIARKSFPESNIYRSGGGVHWLFQNSFKKNIFSQGTNYSNNSIEIAQIASFDLLLVPGMCITEEFVQVNGKTLIDVSNKGIPIIFVGAGALKYDDNEGKIFSNFLNNLKKVSVITRDAETFDLLKREGFKGNLAMGIDCAFFVPELHNSLKFDKKFNVYNFDYTHEPIHLKDLSDPFIRTHHDCWGPLKKEYIDKPNTLVSDLPEDYLNIYANSIVTYSDRVHACLVTIAYGNKAQLFSETPRRNLFKYVGCEAIFDKPTGIDLKILSEHKKLVIEHLTKFYFDK